MAPPVQPVSPVIPQEAQVTTAQLKNVENQVAEFKPVASTAQTMMQQAQAEHTAIHNDINAVNGRVDALLTSIESLTQRVQTLETKLPWISYKSAQLPLVTAGGSVDYTFTWPTAAPNTTYSVAPSVSVSASLLGKITVQPKSKTKTTCTVTVTNSGLVALTAGAEVSAVAIG